MLYVGDSGANHEPGSFDPRRPHHVRAFDVVATTGCVERPPVRGHDAGLPGRDQGRRRRAASTPRRSAACRSSTPTASCSARSDLPGAVNFAFGGPDRNVLFITTDTAVWAAVLDTKGA